ncbi:hypothetical protein T07_8913 [Trichinella nelsoni]|uniref:Uncharacterized protein n=1 Tax=Trichinella nelsoni TaxID=6336 RepID=A0A0V0S4R3_9BILA|nr:hypothetical protein T07_8913 [Trichinella nelsoni]
MESLQMKCFLDWKILSSVKSERKQQRPRMISKKRLWLATFLFSNQFSFGYLDKSNLNPF